LKTKKWLWFFVKSIVDIEWSDGAFESLVLPEDQKELILSFAESQMKNKDSFDDVIAGKGRGIILLLSGPPGVGKTLTAESVAETMHVPLYMMSAGDLGLEPSSIESALQNIMEMVAKWNAVLLLDEADVFLEARSTHELERNKMVSIFLRMLEYYEGILFLTTNRINNIDDAFHSRIHVTMKYPDLNASSRRHIWVNFLKASVKKNDVSDRELDKLADIKLNGRQIKNVLKTAGLLAARKDIPLRYEHINTVLAIEQRKYT
jgi:SpoVK/Ycf46/Vps4 family AAA+-type ATPase